MKLTRVEEPELEEDLLEDDFQDDTSDSFLNDDFGLGDSFGDGRPPMDKHSDLLKELTNFNKFIKDKINGWLGLRWSEGKKTYVKDPHIRPIMNRRCAAWCIDFMKTYTRDNNIITHISSQEYKNIVSDIIEVVWLDIGTRTDEFGITSDADLHKICVEMQHAAELVLMGAGDGKYTKFLSESTQRTENVSYQGQPYPMPSYGSPQQKRKVGLIGKAKQFLLGAK